MELDLHHSEAEAGRPLRFHLQTPVGVQRAFAAVRFPTLEAAYKDVVAAIPDTAAELLRNGIDPMRCSYIICGLDERTLMVVPFTELVREQGERAPAWSGGPRRAPNPILQRSSALRAAASAECARSLDAIQRSRALLAAIAPQQWGNLPG